MMGHSHDCFSMFPNLNLLFARKGTEDPMIRGCAIDFLAFVMDSTSFVVHEPNVYGSVGNVIGHGSLLEMSLLA